MVIVVRGAADIAILREDDVGVDLDGRGIVDLYAVRCGNVVGADEIPRRPDFGGGIEVAVVAKFSAEEAEECGAPGMEGPR